MRILLLAICLLMTFNQLNANAIQQSDNPSVINSDNTVQEEGLFSFVVWGHPRGAIDGDPPLHFEEILQKIRKLSPDALFVTGDVVNGGASQNKPYDPDLVRGDWARFKRATDELGIPVYVSPGNHDTNNFETRDIFLEFYSQPPYAVTMGKQRFLVLDTIGLEQRTKDGTRCPYRQEEFWPVIQGTSVPSRVPCWDIGGLPFDGAQVEFVRNEIATLGAEIEHVFIFMHHTHPWAEHDGWWWDRLHPILKGSPTRAVFSGDPYNGKYGYVLQDEIKYIQSAIFGGVKPGFFASKRNIKHVWHTYHQLDNFQHVVIEGSDPENVKIETIVVGALTSDAGSWRYWDEVSEAYTWSQRLPEQFYKHFHRLKALLLLALSYGAACLVLGMGVVLFWMRWKRNRQMN